MSNLGYIKKNRSEKAKKLKREHTAAYLVLDTIAENAKRKIGDGHPLLEIGEAIITAEECGVTKHQFPRAIQHLESEGMIEIIHRGRKDKNSKFLKRIEIAKNSGIKTESSGDSRGAKSGIKSGINGTIIKLIDTECYEINSENNGNQKQNQFPAISGINCLQKAEQIRNQELINKDIPLSQTLSPKIESIQSATGTDGWMDGFSLSINSINSQNPIDNYENSTKTKLNREQHNIHYLVVYPGDVVKGFLPVKMKRSVLDRCLALKCINGSEEALRERVKEIQEDPNRMEEINNWPRWLPPGQEGGWKSFSKKSPLEERVKENLEFAKRIQRELPEHDWIQGYRSKDHYDNITDQKGFLIECKTGHDSFFTPYVDRNFEEKIREYLNGKGFPVEKKKRITT